MIRTSASLFTGGAGFEQGAMMAGHTPVWGVEIRPDIAHYAELNTPGLKVIVSDVAAVDYASLPKVDHLHASPSCKKASIANSDGGECEEDIQAAMAVCRAIRQVKPKYFTLENVWGYREFESFKFIVKCLREEGYFVDWWHLNSADYGVPQTRKRLILIARKDRQPTRPQPTHSDTPDPWGVYKPWVGWLEAIADLVDSLPDSEFAPWQLERLPTELKSLLLAQGSFDGEVVNRPIKEPSFTVTANSNQAGVRAVLVNSAYPGSNGKKHYEDNEPAFAVDTTAKTRFRAFLLNKSADKFSDGINYAESPAFSVVANSQGRYKAFLLNRNKSERDDHYKPESEPAYTVCVESNGRQRTLLIPGDNVSNGVTRQADEPMVTVQSRGLGQCPHRPYVDIAPAGRVVKMTPRALARFQSLPDSYLLPGSNGLACEIIGNAVPPLLAKAICEELKR